MDGGSRCGVRVSGCSLSAIQKAKEAPPQGFKQRRKEPVKNWCYAACSATSYFNRTKSYSTRIDTVFWVANSSLTRPRLLVLYSLQCDGTDTITFSGPHSSTYAFNTWQSRSSSLGSLNIVIVCLAAGLQLTWGVCALEFMFCMPLEQLGGFPPAS